jgi:hypothetical protein
VARSGDGDRALSTGSSVDKLSQRPLTDPPRTRALSTHQKRMRGVVHSTRPQIEDLAPAIS